jgi:hypothetical protein
VAVVIWVTSPHSPTNTTAKLVKKTRRSVGAGAPNLAASGPGSSSS